MIAGLKIQYAFGGTFVALMRNGQVEASNIEIVVERDGLKETTKLKTNYPQYLGITEHNDHVIVVRENETSSFGVSIQCFELGTEGFPNKFVPSCESPRRAEHLNLEPTYYLRILRCPLGDRSIPILHSNYLLSEALSLQLESICLNWTMGTKAVETRYSGYKILSSLCRP